MTTTDRLKAHEPPSSLRLIRGGRSVDLAAAVRAVSDLLVALGHDSDDEHSRETPTRARGPSSSR